MQWLICVCVGALIVVPWTVEGAEIDIENVLGLREDASRVQGVVEECLDSIVEVYQEFAKDQGLDPKEFAERIEGFSQQVLLATWEEELDLDGDWLDELMNVPSGEDGTLCLDQNVSLPTDDVEFDDLVVGYLYLAKIMKFGTEANIFREVEELRITTDIKAQLEATKTYLQHGRFAHLENPGINATRGGLGKVDSLAIYRTISRLFHNVPLKVLRAIVRRDLETKRAQNSWVGRLISDA